MIDDPHMVNCDADVLMLASNPTLNTPDENQFCDVMIEIELLLKYRNFAEATRRLEQVFADQPDYIPAKEMMMEMCRLTGQNKRSQDLQQEIRTLSEQRAKQQLSYGAREEYAKIEKRQFAEKVERLIKIIYQSSNLGEVLNNTATELLEQLKSDRCIVIMGEQTSPMRGNFEYCAQDVTRCLDKIMTEFLLHWFKQNSGSTVPLISRSCQKDSSLTQYRRLLGAHQIHAIMAYPLTYRSSPMGWVTIQQCVHYYSWNEADATLFATACGHMATAIQNLYSMDVLQDLALKDNLTGLYNRHFLEERLRVELAGARRNQYPLSLAIVDIDHFKHINDTYGHPAGDAVLRKLGYLLKTNVRKGCVVARWGGEEFLVVFPDLELTTVALIMDRFRQKVSQTLEVSGHSVTISIGLAQTSLDGDSTLEQIQARLISEADMNLYKAKNNGRNQLIPSILRVPIDSKPAKVPLPVSSRVLLAPGIITPSNSVHALDVS
jgi:diguanylate cyclase (GGDEF)-like protein